jgi:FkbM family methyltransferase
MGRGIVSQVLRRMVFRGPVRRTAETLLQHAPESVFELARAGESLLQMVQGKGWSSARNLVHEVEIAAGLLPPRDAVVFDVGANVGAWSTEMVRLAAPRLARLVAFEPSAANHESLSRITFPRFELVRAAVGAAPGEMTLFSDVPGSGLASLYQRRLDHHGVFQKPQETVPVVTLDQVAEERGIGRIDFLKMDIEGHELRALDGARRLLEARRVRALSFEFGGSNIDSRTYFQDFWYLLRGLGFRIFRIAPRVRLLEVRRYSEDLEMFTTTDYVARLDDAR